jgi:hypothetical protein
VCSSLAGDLHGLDALHEARRIREIAPEPVERVGRTVHRDAPPYAQRPRARHLHGHPAQSRELLRAQRIDGGHTGHRRGGRRQPGPVRPARGKAGAEQREVHHVADDARPDPRRGPSFAEDANTGGELAEAAEADEHLRRAATSQADATGNRARRE